MNRQADLYEDFMHVANGAACADPFDLIAARHRGRVVALGDMVVANVMTHEEFVSSTVDLNMAYYMACLTLKNASRVQIAA